MASCHRSRRTIAYCALFGFTLGRALAAGDFSERVALLVSPEARVMESQLATIRRELAELPVAPGNENTAQLGWHSAFGPPSGVMPKYIQVDLGTREPFDAVVLVPVRLSAGGQERAGYGFPKRFRVEASDSPEFLESTVLADFTDRDFPNPGSLPVALKVPAACGRVVRITATGFDLYGGRSLFALAELLVLRGGRNLASTCLVQVSDAANNPPAWEPANVTDGQSSLGSPVVNELSPGNGYHSAISKTAGAVSWVQVDLGREMALEEVRLFAAAPVDFPARSGFGFPERFRVEIGNNADLSDGSVLGRFEDFDVPNPGGNPVFLPTGGRSARYVRVSASKLWQRNKDFVFALSELQVISGGLNVALSGNVTALDQTLTSRWSPKFLNDGFTSQGRLIGLDSWLYGLSRRRELEGDLAGMEAEQAEAIARALKWLARWTLLGGLCVVGGGVAWMVRQRILRRQELHALRKRLAADLHDEIGSNLGSISLLSRLAVDASRPNADARSDMNEIHRIAQDTADSMRDIVWLLQPGPRTVSGLVLRLRETAGQLLLGTDYSFETEGVVGPFSLEFERQLLLFFKEALNNIRKHAEARRVDIMVQQTGAACSVRITDNGVGFDAQNCTSGIGLEGMQQRAQSLGGFLRIHSSPGKGTQIELNFQIP